MVLFDATFLQRDDLRDHRDEVSYLDAQLDRAQARGITRDQNALGGLDQALLGRVRISRLCPSGSDQ
jgi:uridine kinase